MLNAVFYPYRLLKIAYNVFGSIGHLPLVTELEPHFEKYRTVQASSRDATSLDLGCGISPKNPFRAKRTSGVDVREGLADNIRRADLTVEGIPFDDESFDFVTAFDLLEHVPRIVYLPARRLPFIELMNEVWRVLRVGGIFCSHTPVFPFAPAFQDPTHVNILTHQTFPLYFDDKRRWGSTYGFRGSFEVLEQLVRPPHLISFLRKTTPPKSAGE